MRLAQLNGTLILEGVFQKERRVIPMLTVPLTIEQKGALEDFTNEFETMNALADRNRQKIILLLSERLQEGMTVTEITQMMAITQPAVSHHLKILREAGLVSFKKEGLQSFYRVTLDEPLKRLEVVIHNLLLKLNPEEN